MNKTNTSLRTEQIIRLNIYMYMGLVHYRLKPTVEPTASSEKKKITWGKKKGHCLFITHRKKDKIKSGSH